MGIIATSFNNKNQYRRYPLKQGQSAVSNDGVALPDTVLTNCAVSTTYGKHRLYIRQIFYKASLCRITLASVFDDSALGVFEGDVSSDFSTLKLTPFVSDISGSITVGSLRNLPTGPRVLIFSKEATELEESTIFCYPLPGVTSVTDKLGNSLRGAVQFGALVNLTKKTIAGSSLLSVNNTAGIVNLADKSTFLGNCDTPMIKTINGVTPFAMGEASPENDNNIYIAGVKPVVFYSVPQNDNTATPGIIGTDTGTVTLDKLCTQKHKLSPPVDVSGFTLATQEFKNMYYSKPALAAAGASENYVYPRPERLASNFNATTKP